MTKIYIVTGCAVGDGKYAEDGVIEFTQPFGSVTEVCKFLKKMYNFPEKDSRKLIINSFGQNTKLWIQVPDGRSVRISQHKVDSEVRLHGDYE
mgnify:CR=1 FL=1